VPATGPFRSNLLSDLAVRGGSVFVRRLKKPNLAVLLGLAAGAGAGSVLDLRASRSLWRSGVSPRGGARDSGAAVDVGPGDGIREGAFVGTPTRDRAAGAEPFLDSAEGVRLWEEGKAIMLLCITGDGPRMPMISGVPSRLGRVGRRLGGNGAGEVSAK
jgi:hypothetical protein